MSKRKWRWVSRDKTGTNYDSNVHNGARKPKPIDGLFFDGLLFTVSSKEFRRLFGFCPKPGDAMKVEFTAKVVKE